MLSKALMNKAQTNTGAKRALHNWLIVLLYSLNMLQS